MSQVTIGVPIYNEEKTLEYSLDSIVLSASKLDLPYDIVLCFNGTTDGGRSIAENYHFPLKIIESSKGKPWAIQSINNHSDADFFIFTDADTVVHPDCFSKLINAYSPKVMAVTGRPLPYPNNSLVYNIINARMLNQDAEVSKNPLAKMKQKPFLHGRIYSVRKMVMDELTLKFSENLGDDTFLSHHLFLYYGRESIVCVKDANVSYHPVTSIGSWWKKWSRIWKDLDNLYQNNPEFNAVKKDMETKIDWSAVPLDHRSRFVCERILHHIGHAYFEVIKNYREIGWTRLDDTKVIK
ncbi:TPA: glycosyltransferase [Candidatus Woesearchaeota archaeon]|nr:glycosyltransferase [Candidatus Woesearchaeota archaeon]HIG93871.1 glycosyltransferase [Candidatus Woesearchaeota archaeon]HIH12807.1 glycosyltransferase [Candidatus Woesearchaeota archaeon]